ncbi:MAG TPA: quinolinate synthase NadA [Candidatus Nanoarchaeia archaeon]|nr:quinolinate synthase NadA [Candidatus Nanoarchaeia archaeon]
MADLDAIYRGAFEADPLLKVDAEANRDIIERILELRERKNVLILGHNYMHPLVYNLSDEKGRGDSLALSKYAATTDKPIILFDGVLFMGETAKILNPGKKVLIADKSAGCSLADPIRKEDVIKLKQQYPGIPVVTYINSYADVKAESDICCTSANAIEVVLSLKSKRVIFLPDSFMGENIQQELKLLGHDIEIIYPGKNNLMRKATCEVHEKFTVEDLRLVRKQHEIPKGHPKRAILAHWECLPEVLREADFYGSTSQMAKYIKERNPEKVFLATECEMAANLANEFPQTEFVRQCNAYCQHMRKITLKGILSALETEDAEKHEIFVDEEIRLKSLRPIQRMLEISG